MTKNEAQLDGNHFPGTVVDAQQESNAFIFSTGGDAKLILMVLRADVLRFRYCCDPGVDEDFSYAIADDFKTGVNHIDFVEDAEGWTVSTSLLNCQVSKKALKVTVSDRDGRVLSEDELGFHWQDNLEHGGIVPKMSKFNSEGQSYYGMGDKPMSLNLVGRRLSNWNSDEYAFLPDHDPLYKSIPFYISVHEGVAHGIFFDNSFATHFDFGSERGNVTSFWADGGEMNYYLIYGPQIEATACTFAQLTGTAELPPLWALGYHQSKWSYYPQARVDELAKQFRDNKVPCDALYLDIDYMDGFRCFTWDKERFPKPKEMISELKDMGFRTVLIIDPGIKCDKEFSVYQEGVEKNYFCRRADGPFMRGKVWPGDCLFPDFTNPDVREWWAGLYKDLIADGVDGIWNDMNEPAVMDVPDKTFPADVRHDYDGHPCSHRKAHNVYGMQMVRATYEGLKKLGYPRRPFVITRAAYAGAQRYCSTWTGDNIATWDHLKVANMQVQRLNLSGMGFCSSDIGGFEEQPSPELYARWIQLGVFHPFCRTHSSGHHGDQEPWAFGKDVLDIARRYIELRYQLLQYLYTTFYENTRFGTPVLRSVVMEDQDDAALVAAEDDFMFGRHILVCPIMEEDTGKPRAVYLPRGQWYGLHDNSKHAGQLSFETPVTAKDIPVYVRAGAVIPRLPVQQYSGELKIEELRLDVYHSDGEVQSRVYEDALDGYDYKVDGYLLRTFTVSGENTGQFSIRQRHEGKFKSQHQRLRLNFIGLTIRIGQVLVDGEPLNHPQDSLNDTTVIVPEDFTEVIIKS
ncbi:MAG: DUF4968 domain-containing protein [Gammaproteobacteria bacterium]|nr:DUF4968 domain-containing protein [Gammaproteobacteria bacterium]